MGSVVAAGWMAEELLASPRADANGQETPWGAGQPRLRTEGVGSSEGERAEHSIHSGSPGQGAAARWSPDTSSPRSHAPHRWGKASLSLTWWKGNSTADQEETASLVMSLQRPLLTKLNLMCPARRSAESQSRMKVKVKVTQSSQILCDPKDDRVHGILQARILEWVAFPFSRGSSEPRDQTQVSRIAGGFFTS